MIQDEVRMLDNRCVLLFICGKRSVMDFEYDILKHGSVDRIRKNYSAYSKKQFLTTRR